MPSGRIHTLATISLATITAPLMEPTLTLGVMTGCILSPDTRDARNYIQRLRGLVDGRKIGKSNEKEFFLTPDGVEIVNQFIGLVT